VILEVEDIDTFYGRSHVLQGVSLNVETGEVVSLLGRNGVGKTTSLKSVMGLVPPARGSIRFKGREIAGKKAFAISRMGVAYVPDDRRIFVDLTTYENMEISRRMSGLRDGAWSYAKVFELFPILLELRDRKGSHLSGGEQKMLAIARALITNPVLLLLDEPSEGLAPLVVRNLTEVTMAIRDEGVTILLADQNFKFCKRVSTRGYILEKGQIQYHDDMDKIWENQDVVKKFLAL
jgi:branched-chain amino acid transport system ATP-binding protein